MESIFTFTVKLLKKYPKGVTIRKLQNKLIKSKLLALGSSVKHCVEALVNLRAVVYDKKSEMLKLGPKRDLEFAFSVSKEVNRHLVFAKSITEVIILVSKCIKLEKKAVWQWLNNRNPHFDDGKRTPLEVLWQDGKEGIQKIKDFISSYRAGDYA